ncbi:hypothetical protein TVAG_195720 [Trichomonas vaginalis G3]|uniref:Bap-like n=1 Tax=Trichomonas vaginalis (strain ATCC PRA-98 / G3) TaxID=412133 RepID=A2ETL1_TRIV3|nr:hypothetical protein TVAGG3_0403930 [Trichomonas vaginalis G3]EAY03979.1 hypothetical protein TVAG_195720 [Trichomonas vaginalis G3]KAI5534893.1 hypothetical protein TVAGG3_0403930 [Trichomonas vaginalis G3]|eukprot:XP_001316202.1 hypothetical protein [Trichomonas vaginalis G3]
MAPPHRIDDTPISQTDEITVTESPKDFNVFFKIPDDYKYGPHNLNVQGFDVNGEKTSNTNIKFVIQNPPKIISISLEKERVQPGHVLRFSGIVRDPDLNNTLKFIGRIDSAADEIVHRMVADSTEQEFAFEYIVDADIEVGEHEFIVKVVDDDDYSSGVATVGFTVYKPSKEETEGGNGGGINGPGKDDSSSAITNTTTKKSSTKGLIAGIVIVGIILVVLIIVAVILFMKSRGVNSAPKDQDSVSDHSDLEEKETEIMTASTVTPDEIATRDNPLFSSNEINNDGDPFSDEFEEQQQV